MRTPAQFPWGGLAVGLVMGLVGCAGSKVSEAPKDVATTSQPCEAATKAMEILRSQADSGDAKHAPQEPGAEGVLAPAEVLRAGHLLRRRGPGTTSNASRGFARWRAPTGNRPRRTTSP